MDRKAFNSLFALIGTAIVVVALVLLLREQAPQTISSLDSPLPTPTLKIATATKVKSTPWPTPKPTSTRPPEPTRRLPTPKPTLGPHTPTPEPLPTLIPGRDTFVYSTTGARGPEIWRVQADETGRISERGLRVHTPDWWRSRVFVSHLYPSPSGKQIAVEWVYGEGGSNVSLLDVNEGYLNPLFDNTSVSDSRIEFLDWSPDGNTTLVIGAVGNPELGGRAWELDLDTNKLKSVDMTQERDAQQITDASYSPDGQSIVYAKSKCYQCGSEIWKINPAQQERLLLLTEPKRRIGNVEVSPDGNRIAYTLWEESTDQQEYISGELWLLGIDGKDKQLIAPAITGYHYQYGPVWSSSNNSIAFIMNEDHSGGQNTTEIAGNLGVSNVVNGELKQLTHLQSKRILQPVWSPDGSKLAFVVDLDSGSEQFLPWVIGVDGRDLRRIGEQANLSLDTSASLPSIVWLPSSRSIEVK